MGRQVGGVHISGKFGDMQFYVDDMQGFVRVSNPPTKAKIMKDPNYEQLRKNMAETTGTSKAADALTKSFGDDWTRFGERYLRARMMKLLRGILVQGPGFKGERKFEAAPHLSKLASFDLNKHEKLEHSFSVPFTVTVNPDRNTATFDVLSFIMNAHAGLVPYATHFRVFMTVGVLTDFVHVGGEMVYDSTQPSLVGLRSRVETAPIAKGPVLGFQLVASLPGQPVLPSDAYLVVCVGVQYMQVIGGREEIFSSGDAMKIVGVY